MKMSNKELIGFFAALGALRATKMPARLAWKLCVAEKVIKPFGDAFDIATEELRKRHAERNEAGEPVGEMTETGFAYKIAEENLKAANDELKELMAETFEVSSVELTLADFPESFEVTPEIMSLLAPLMEMTQQNKKK